MLRRIDYRAAASDSTFCRMFSLYLAAAVHDSKPRIAVFVSRNTPWPGREFLTEILHKNWP
jgi:hypothetical protein